MSSSKEEVFSCKGFEEFLQQAEMSGISKDRQAELMSMYLAQGLTLDVVILQSVKKALADIVVWSRGFIETAKKRKGTVIICVLFLAILGFLVVSEHRARTGKTEYQPWQFTLAAMWRLFQGKYLSFIPWHALYNLDCVVENPFYDDNKGPGRVVDCINDPRTLKVLPVKDYNSEVLFPLVVEDAQQNWMFGKLSTLSDVHKFLSAQPAGLHPCVVHYMKDVILPPEMNADPLGALVRGNLQSVTGERLETFFLRGCSNPSNRLLRSMFQRPIFVGQHVEQLGKISAIVAKDVTSGSILKYHLKRKNSSNRNWMWIAQVIGSSTVVLGDVDCPDNPPIQHVLQPGDIVGTGSEETVTVRITSDSPEVMILYNKFTVEE